MRLRDSPSFSLQCEIVCMRYGSKDATIPRIASYYPDIAHNVVSLDNKIATKNVAIGGRPAHEALNSSVSHLSLLLRSTQAHIIHLAWTNW
jgi:hypothetical protein